MKIIYKTTITICVLLFTFLGNVNAQQDLSIGNISAGYSYNSSTGVISDIYFTILSNENDAVSEYGVGVYFCIPSATSLDDCYLLKALVDESGISGNAAKDVEIDAIDVNQVDPLPPNGSYRLMIYVDHEMEIDESDENNNGLFISTQGNNLNFTATGSTAIHPNTRNQLAVKKVFPVPAANFLHILLNDEAVSGEYKIQILSLEGRELMNESVQVSASGIISLNISSLKTGMYLYKLSNNEGSSFGRLVKK